MSLRTVNVLSIAGSDPSGGAGIQADLKTFAALGVYGCAALTALTAQNTVEVSGVFSIPVDFLRRQLEAVFTDVSVDAVKIGMLGTADTVRMVAAVLRAYQLPYVVLDPVLHATTGARLLDADALDALRGELLPLVTIVTPNADEAGALLGIAPPRSVAEARKAAAMLVERGGSAALVTGGHLADAEFCVDVLHDGSTLWEFPVPRAPSGRTHGTGCTLSSAVAALLARGHGLQQACAEAQRFVAASITRGADLRVGRGARPVHQLGDLWARAAP
ncbi:MAG: bifunctional hydroxymethylpyrimidine kinase/phosphomethylpyrimidine kinase [Gemmatimonadaceae bacterium]